MLLSAATVFQHLFHAVQALMVAIVAMEIGCLEAAGFVGSYDTSFAAIDGAALTTVHIYACLRARCFCRQPLLSFFLWDAYSCAAHSKQRQAVYG